MKKNNSPHFTILYEDEYCIAVNKSAPFLTIPDRFNHDALNLSSLLKEIYGDMFVVHRLDRETSGVILFAKNAEIHKALCCAFENREVQKEYQAFVQGIPHDKEGEINLSIDENPSKKGTMIISKKGKESVTKYSVAEEFGKYALLSVFPLTGRTHQIRIHLKALGYPLMVDSVYGERGELYLSEIKRGYRYGKDTEEKAFVSRCTLHARSLTFTHPVHGTAMMIEAPLPKDLNALLNQLRKNRRFS
jgi:23S rRNA pseudouridine1911/1915/1917 synthase